MKAIIEKLEQVKVDLAAARLMGGFIAPDLADQDAKILTEVISEMEND